MSDSGRLMGLCKHEFDKNNCSLCRIESLEKLLAIEQEKTTATAKEWKKLHDAIVLLHSQKADDRCWMDLDKLFAVAGLPPADRQVGNKLEMIKNCIRFIEQDCEAAGWPTYMELEQRIKFLEEAIVGFVQIQDVLAPLTSTKSWNRLQELAREIENRSKKDE